MRLASDEKTRALAGAITRKDEGLKVWNIVVGVILGGAIKMFASPEVLVYVSMVAKAVIALGVVWFLRRSFHRSRQSRKAYMKTNSRGGDTDEHEGKSEEDSV